MCVAIPAEVIEADEMTALVDVYGNRFTVSLMMMPETVAPGDFVALQAQRYAVAKVAPEEAHEARRLFEEFFPELAARAAVTQAA